MALDDNFIPPEKSIAEAETAKRSELIKWFSEAIDEAVVGLIVSGSMSYGYDYSVKEASDVDMQLIVTPETVSKLKDLSFFEANELDRAIAGYLAGFYGQFSLVFQKDGVNMECHFWGLDDFIKSITYQVEETDRLRSSIEPTTDRGCATFSGHRSERTYEGRMVDGYPVGPFPSYWEEQGVIYLCRPITNILGMPIIVKSTPEIDRAIDQAWNETVSRLALLAEDGSVDLAKYNIVNTLPGKNKMREDKRAEIMQKTASILQAMNLS